jgi:four helix bundle protein
LTADHPAAWERSTNDPEVIMSQTVSRSPNRPLMLDADRGRSRRPRPTVTVSELHAHALALEAAGIAIGLVMRVPTPLKPIADRLIRSASSVPANLAEGHGRSGRDRTHLWRIAYASAKEVDSHLRLLIAAAAVNRERAEDALQLFDRVRAMAWRLLHPSP